MPKKIHQPDNLELMGALVELHAAMAVADGIRLGKTDLLAHANRILRDANLETIATPDQLSEELGQLVELGIVAKAGNKFQLTEAGAKALAILLYGRRWQEHVQPSANRAARYACGALNRMGRGTVARVP